MVHGNDPDIQTLSIWGRPVLQSPGPPSGAVSSRHLRGSAKGQPLSPVKRPLTWESPVDFRTLMWAVSGGYAGVPDTWYPFTVGEKHCSEATQATRG